MAVLLDAGIDIESVAFTDQDGGEWRANAVWFATGRGQNLPLLKFLLERGGDGRTALHAAAVPHRLEVLGLYLDAGADPRIKDNEGIAPLDLAKKRRVPKELIERMERSV